MAFAQPGQYGPAALLDTAGLPVIGAAVQAPTGYTAVVDEFGNLTVTGPPADAVALSFTPVGGVTTPLVIKVSPAVGDLDVAAQVAAAEARSSSTYLPAKRGSGAPTIAGAVGDYYFRTDTPGTVGQRIYVCTAAGAAGAATWVATAA